MVDIQAMNIDGLRSMAVFIVKPLRGRLLLLPSPSRYLRTILTSHVEVYRGCGGLALATPAISQEIVGCWPTLTPSTLSLAEAIADRYALIDLW